MHSQLSSFWTVIYALLVVKSLTIAARGVHEVSLGREWLVHQTRPGLMRARPPTHLPACSHNIHYLFLLYNLDNNRYKGLVRSRKGAMGYDPH